MNNKEKYDKAFTDSLLIKKDVLKDLTYSSIPEWDSIGHMTLIADLEKTFNITMETDDIIDLGSYKKGIEILKKYKIDI